MNGNKSVAYTDKEKMLLAQLVKDNSIVENKQTDGASVLEKNQAWEIITVAYNSQPEVNIPRTSGQLRKLWTNLKQRKRKEATALRHSFLATGGGPPPKTIKIDPVLEFVEDAAPSVNLVIDSYWDSTTIFEKDQAEGKIGLKGKAAGTSIPLYVVDDSDEVSPIPTPTILNELFLPNFATVPHKTAAFTVSRKDFKGTMPLVSAGTSTAPEPAVAVGVSTEAGGEFKQIPHLIGGTLPRVSACTSTAGGSGSSQQQVPAVQLHTETGSRARKVKPCMSHQQELHDLRKQVIEEYRKAAEIDRKRAETDMKRAELEYQRATDEAELAKLKLQHFKKRMLSEDP